jgi:hypothetical protein
MVRDTLNASSLHPDHERVLNVVLETGTYTPLQSKHPKLKRIVYTGIWNLFLSGISYCIPESQKVGIGVPSYLSFLVNPVVQFLITWYIWYRISKMLMEDI